MKINLYNNQSENNRIDKAIVKIVELQGYLSGDNVHPSALGCKTISNRFITDLPQIIK